MERLEFAWSSLDRPRLSGSADAALCELESRAGRRRRNASFATAALVLLIGAGVGWQLTSSPTHPPAPAFATAALRLPALQSLPDGSVAEIRDGGEIAVMFTENERRVELRRGEVYFKVAKNPARPFVVVANGVKFRAVGTEFSVQMESTSLELLVAEGTVAVEQSPAMPVAGGAESAPPLLVSAGDGASVQISPEQAKTAIGAMINVDLQTRLAWRNPRLEFSGTPLLQAVTLMNRHNRMQFVIEDPELAKVRVSGIFGATNTAALIHLLEASFNVQAERRSDDEIVLRSRR